MFTAIRAFLGTWQIYLFLGALAVTTGYGALKTYQLSEAHNDLLALQKDDATAQAAAEKDAREKEAKFATASAKVADAYEQGKKDAQANGDNVLTMLGTGTLSLQPRWKCPSFPVSKLPATPTDPAKPNATSADGNASAARIVRAAASCDAQVKQCQNLLLTERGLPVQE